MVFFAFLRDGVGRCCGWLGGGYSINYQRGVMRLKMATQPPLHNTRGDCNWGESACSFSWRSFIAAKLVMAKGGRPWCWLCTLCVSPIGKVDTQSNGTSWRTSLKFSDCGVGGPYISWIGSAETLLGSLWEGPWDISSWIEDGDMVYNHHLCLKGGFVALVA